MAFRRLLKMFAAGNPRAEQFWTISVICMAVLAAAIVLFALIHIRRRLKSDKLAREIMDKCEEEDRYFH